jgi:hypothetical protein
MNQYEQLLAGGDLRSIGNSNAVSATVDTQQDFDDLMELLNHQDRRIVMRAIDVIEKVTRKHTAYLKPHTERVMSLLPAKHIELKWHIALLLGRIDLPDESFARVWNTLSEWAINKQESKIVRVNSLQTLFELSERKKAYTRSLQKVVGSVLQENIPSINARVKKLGLL